MKLFLPWNTYSGRIFLAVLILSTAQAAFAAPPQAALSWTAPTANTDNSAIVGTLTYNIYQGATCTTLAKVQSGVTTTSATITTGLVPGSTPCFAVTASLNGTESAQSNAVTSSTPIPFPTPNAPTAITIVIQ